jgi:hypothetical protein
MRNYAKRFTAPLLALPLLAFPLFGSSLVTAQTTVGDSTLTAIQKAQAAEVAQSTEVINQTNGYVSVNSNALVAAGLSLAQVDYVESTIQEFDSHYGLTSSTTPPSGVISPLTVSPNTAIWLTTAGKTGQQVMLYEGTASTGGLLHMNYRHNWYTGGTGTAAIQNAVTHVYSATPQSNGRIRYISDWFYTTIPFESWKVRILLAVNSGNATGNDYTGPGSVWTGYPVAGNYTVETWHGVPNTSIVPYWVNYGFYTIS